MPAFRPLFLLFVLTTVAACDRSRTTAAELPEKGRGAVWLADKPGSPGRLYLCGTIHILREEDYPLAEGYEKAYADAEKLVFELPPGTGDDGALTSRMRELGSYAKGDALPAHVSAATWKAVQAWSEKRGMPAASLAAYRPWFVSLVIAATEYAALGAKPDQGVDQHFEDRAKKDGKPGQGLETPEFQIQLFTQLSEEQQNDLLEQTLAEVGTLPADYKKMIGAWKNGDLETLHDMLFREAEKFPELMDMFLIHRNRAWLDPLLEMLNRGEKVMVLVGAGHLAGDAGLVRLLEEKGCRVRHITEMKDP